MCVCLGCPAREKNKKYGASRSFMTMGCAREPARDSSSLKWSTEVPARNLYGQYHLTMPPKVLQRRGYRFFFFLSLSFHDLRCTLHGIFQSFFGTRAAELCLPSFWPSQGSLVQYGVRTSPTRTNSIELLND